MQNILAALLGGAGAGLTSYGQAGIREQEQARAAQQRMAEQEAMRKARLDEIAAQERNRIAREEAENAELTAAVGGLLKDRDWAKDVKITPRTVPIIQSRLQTERTTELAGLKAKQDAEDADAENRGYYNALLRHGRLKAGTPYDPTSRYKYDADILKQEDGQDARRQFRIEFPPTVRPPGEPPSANDRRDYIARVVEDLMKPRSHPGSDSEVPGMDLDSATAEANRRANAIFGGGAPMPSTGASSSATQQPPSPAASPAPEMTDEGRIAQFAKDDIAAVMADKRWTQAQKLEQVARINSQMADAIRKIRAGRPQR